MFRHSSLSLPLKLSMKAFSVGFPGRMKARYTALASAQASITFPANSLPLSTVMDAGLTGAPIEAFSAGQFSTGVDASPEATLGSTADQPNLRILAHGRTKDWLAVAGSTGTTPGYQIWLWKAPASGTEDVQTVDLGSTVQIRGLAVVAAD